MNIIILVITVSMLVIAAFYVVWADSFFTVLAASSMVSVGLVLLFVLLRAPDVALTEAVVGVALTGVIYALTLAKIDLWKINDNDDNNDVSQSKQ